MNTGGVPLDVAAFVGTLAFAAVFFIVFLGAISKRAPAEPEEPAPKKPHVHDCAKHGHVRRYLALKNITLRDPWACGTAGHVVLHEKGRRVWYARWVCGRCTAYGQECRGDLGDWKIEHEQLVFDEKAFANIMYPDPPKPELQPGDLSVDALKAMEYEVTQMTGRSTWDIVTIARPILLELLRRRKEAGL